VVLGWLCYSLRGGLLVLFVGHSVGVGLGMVVCLLWLCCLCVLVYGVNTGVFCYILLLVVLGFVVV